MMKRMKQQLGQVDPITLLLALLLALGTLFGGACPIVPTQ